MKAETFIVCVEGLGVLALRNNTYLPEANEFLCHLLTGPSSVFSNMNDEASLSALRHCAAIILRKCLTAANSSSTTKSSLFALINAAQGVYADVNESEPFSREYIVYVNSIVALAGISPALKPKEVIEVAIPLLTRRLRDGPDVHFESLMWECLGNVGLTCDESVYTEVVSFMLEHSKRTFSKIAKISHTLARMDGRSSTFHRIYLEYILTMFMEKASTLHTATSAQALQTIGELKELSNILRIICDQWDFSPNATAAPAGSIDHKEPDTEIAVLFRNFWLYMVLYVLQPNGRWPSSEKDSYGGWAAIALSIAAKTPPLVLLSQSTNLEVELSANSILRGKLSEATITRARSALSNILPASAATELRNLSFLESAYLLAVFQIETLRIRRSWDVSYIFKYLTEERFYGTNVYSVFELLADEVCKIFVRDNIGPEGSQALKNSTNPEPGTTDIIRSIEAHARELILRAAHRRERVRKAAKRAVVNVLEYFPATLWNSRLLTLMLDILQVLDALACGASGKKEAGLVARSQIDLSFVNAQDASGAAHDFFELCVMWLQTANKRCASETTGLLQRYLIVLHIEFPNLSPTEKSDLTSLMSRFYAHPEAKAAVMQSLEKTALYMGEVQGMLHSLMWMQGWSLSECNQRLAELMKGELEKIIKGGESAHHNHHHGHSDEVLSTELSQRLNSWLHRAVALIISADKEFDEDLLRSVCWTPIALFSAEAMEVGIGAWSWIMNARPDLATGILGTLLTQWEHTAVQRFGLYGKEKRPLNAFMQKMTYAPAVPPTNAEDATKAHQLWIRFLSDRFRVCRHTGRESTKIFTKLVQIICSFSANARTNPIVRETRWMSLNLGLKVVADLDKKNDPAAPYIRFAVYSDAFDWFSAAPRWGAPSTAEVASLVEFYTLLKASRPERSQKLLGQWTCKPGKAAFASHIIGGRVELDDAHQILLLFLENEINRLGTWHDPLDEKDGELSVPQISERTVKWTSTVQSCWAISPALALQLRARVVGPGAEQIEKDLAEIFKTNALSLISLEHAHPPGAKPAHHTLGQSLDGEGLSLLAKLSATAPTNMALRALLYWAPLPPISAVALLGPGSQKAHPWVLQFATKVLEFFPVDQVFFYIPQMVQALRYDVGGYMEHFILETAKLSQLFAHQIIWNMRANIDPEGKPDPARTVFERIIEEIVHALSGSDKEFYEREFKFFEEVTSISGKLKPYIPKSKQEKKKKIDEELRLIKVDVGVYLPSNPESIVVDIDYDSGRPLQSHAKAPFMATFKIRRADEDDTTDSSGTETDQNTTPLWQSAIFKVGDDCRQDVLALQLISIFKNIFSVVGLDLYVFPYRVVATAAGCGIIEVIPKSISRDMMGREKVNDLFGYFRAKFGPTDSMKFQKARLAFVKSLAPYSLILYLLQIKDRHNGNIMFDEDGHILHIDFGFILDIAPGGIKFEASPFKLTTEMVEVMGGDATTPAYHLFSEKVVQAYLAVRPYADEIIHMVSLMIDSGLPCFKEATLRNLRDRFQLQLSERAAADFMMARIKESHENTFSVMYDGFQKLQNGIPY
ncbi:hypothetical protein BJ742DRAFT_830677 [Cladochytrium replicatum]|nr:hypothetical protein BJ742DRAFT_830677 [Cladochytrium replicatum]